jgi:hypothetical protein
MLLPSKQALLEVERHPAESHLCKSQETIEIILWVGVYIGDGNLPRSEIVFAEQDACAKPSYLVSSCRNSGSGISPGPQAVLASIAIDDECLHVLSQSDWN